MFGGWKYLRFLIIYYFRFDQLSTKEHLRFQASYATILRAHMQALKKRERKEKKKVAEGDKKTRNGDKGKQLKPSLWELNFPFYGGVSVLQEVCQYCFTQSRVFFGAISIQNLSVWEP